MLLSFLSVMVFMVITLILEAPWEYISLGFEAISLGFLIYYAWHSDAI